MLHFSIHIETIYLPHQNYCMTNIPEITLLPFQPADQAAVKDLILAGLAEHWGTLDPSKNPDLDDIAASYAAASNSGATFLVARYQDRIIGTGALVPRQNGIVEVVRMSVAANGRRQGIGRMILQALVDRARQDGFQRIILETTETWQEVIAFYLHFGFRITHYKDGDVYFELTLVE
jgi:GNAT superfamily N-acetyltransferase